MRAHADSTPTAERKKLMTQFKDYEVTIRVGIQCTGTGTLQEDIAAETIEALTMHDQWPVEVRDLDSGVVTEMTIPAVIHSGMTEGGVLMSDLPSYEVGEKVVFEEISFYEGDPPTHEATIVEVLIPRKFYNVQTTDGKGWTVSGEQLRRA